MSVYEVITEDGSVYEVTTEDGPTAQVDDRPSIWDAGKQGGKNILTGIAGLADLALLASPAGMANQITQTITKQSTPTIRETVNQAIPEYVQGGAADIIKAAQEASVLPIGGPVANAISGAGAEIAHQMFPESKVAPFVGALAGPTVATAGGKVAKVATAAGKAFERASVGAGARSYLKSQRVQGLLEDAETGEAMTRLKQAINEIGDTEGWGTIRTPEVLQERVTSKLQEYGGKIGKMATAADNAGIQPSLPFAKTQTVIGKATASKGQLKKALDEFIEQFTDPVDGWDGTVTGLSKWSRDIRNLGFTGTATGQLKANVGRSLQRAIGQDLQTAIKDAMGRAGYSADEIEKAFRGYSNYATVAPVIAENVVKGESSTGASLLRGLLRTSGGTLTTPTMIGTVVGGATGGPVGLAAGALLGGLASPTGAGRAGSSLKGAARAISGALGKTSSALPGAIFASVNPTIKAFNGLGRETKAEVKKGNADQGKQNGDNPIHNANFTALFGKAPAKSSLFATVANRDNNNSLLASLFGGGQMREKGPGEYTALVNKLAPALVRVESYDADPTTDDARAVSSKGARGLYQIMPDTWEWFAPKVPGVDVSKPFDPTGNEKVGKAYLAYLLDRFGGRPELALAAYNWGEGKLQKLIDRWGNTYAAVFPQLPRGVQNYVTTILKNSELA